jgi:hypothetical protein
MSSLSLAAKFPRAEPAQRAYREVYRILEAVAADLSVFRISDDTGHYVAVVGEEPNLERWRGLAFQLTLQGGTIIALDDATIDGLLARRRGH